MTDFQQAMRNAGIDPPSSVYGDGKLHRFHVSGDDKVAKNGWYVLYDNPPAGVFGCWRRGIRETWSSKTYQTMSTEEQSRYKANMEAARREREAEESRIHAECSKKAKQILDGSKPAPADHPYLQRKQINPHGARVSADGKLIIPVRGGDGTLHGLQFINQDGSKKFLTGTAKAGNYYSIGGKPVDIIYLAEGFATAATIHEVTGKPVAVAFDAGNLKPVAETLSAKLPGIQLIVCADDDHGTPGNPGITKATEAAVAVGGLLAVPDFTSIEHGQKDTDFNDLHRLAGVDAAKRCIEAATKPAPPPLPSTRSPSYGKSGNGNSYCSDNSQSKSQVIVPWPTLSPAALPGIVGDFINAACEHSEADPAAILATFLCRFGIQCGAAPHLMVGDTKHHARLNAIIVGDSSKARKGTSAGPVDAAFEGTSNRCRTTPGPLSTGEGIIYNVRDEQQTWVIDRKTKVGEWEVADPGVTDKRLFVLDEEFAAALQSTRREGNTLSSVIRTLFDSGNAEPLTKGNRCKATGAHVGIVSHITIGELLKLLTETEQINGFGNRFLWVLAKRQKKVPFPRPLKESVKARITRHIDDAVYQAQNTGVLAFNPAAMQMWAEEYSDLSEAVEGRAGHMVSRGEAIVIRLALLYALLGMRREIGQDDLRAALAFWDYCQQSALYLFSGNAPTTKRRKKILEIVDAKGGAASRSDLLAGLGGHTKAEVLDDLLDDMEKSGLITIDSTKQVGGTKPLTIVKRNANYPNYPNYLPQRGESSESSENSQGIFANAVGDDLPEFNW